MYSASELYRLDNGFTAEVLSELSTRTARFDLSPDYPTEWENNPITIVVKDDVLWETFCEIASAHLSRPLSGKQVLASQVICQQVLWHFGGRGEGPEGDGLPKTLRKLWYAGHKDAIQYISARLDVWRDGDQMNDRAANSAMSLVYGDFVDTGIVTYLDLYVKDGSRQFEKFPSYNALPSPLGHIVFCIEKDAAYEDCVLIAKALGARVALSGSGKMGKAGTERMIRESLSRWFDTDNPGDSVTDEDPVYLLVISDWDYDGEAVIAPTFVNQMRRYIPDHLLNWVRVGIRPAQIEESGYTLSEKAYQVKFHVNSAYSKWCKEKAIFVYQGRAYSSLDDLWYELDSYERDRAIDRMESKLSKADLKELDSADGYHNEYDLLETHSALKALFELFPPLGFELDALRRVEYADIIIQGLLELIDWDDLIDALSKKEWASVDDVTETLTGDVLSENESYCELEQHITEIEQQFNELMETLRSERNDFANDIRCTIRQLVETWKEDERVTDNDSEPDRNDLIAHLRKTTPWDHWKPFSREDRNDALVGIVKDEEKDRLSELTSETIDFDRVAFSSA